MTRWGWWAGLALLAAAPLAWWGRGLSAEDHRREARRLSEAGHPEAALAALGRLEGLGPLSDEDRCMRGHIRLDLGAFDAGLADLETVPDDARSGLAARLLGGQALLRLGRLGAAERAFLRALEIDPSSNIARRELIYIYGAQLRREEMGEQFRALSELTGLTAKEVWIWCLSDNLAWWEPSEVVADYERYLAAEPDNASTRLAAAENYRRMARPGDAVAVLAPLKGDPRALAFLARLALERRDVEAAATLLAPMTGRGGPDLAHVQGLLALYEGKVADAVASLRIARESLPRRRAILSDLARALRMIGGEEEVGAIQERIRRLDAVATLLLRMEGHREGTPPLDLLRSLGVAYEGLEEPEKARAWYRVILARDPLDVEAQRGIARLTAGRANSVRPAD